MYSLHVFQPKDMFIRKQGACPPHMGGHAPPIWGGMPPSYEGACPPHMRVACPLHMRGHAPSYKGDPIYDPALPAPPPHPMVMGGEESSAPPPPVDCGVGVSRPLFQIEVRFCPPPPWIVVWCLPPLAPPLCSVYDVLGSCLRSRRLFSFYLLLVRLAAFPPKA